ncbi:SCO family protein [Fodinicurvata halophila]|uniref:SCO family protein n=1 Tax=Fodinicurvata halophila TaxID=1419723 RepID=A0ABV8UM73_9PROT
MTQRGRIYLLSALVLLLVMLIAAGGLVYRMGLESSQSSAQERNDSELAESDSVPIGGDFNLVNDQGEDVTQATYDDSYKLVFFGFTHCPDICPTTLSDITRTMERLGSAGEPIQPLFISVDPQRDTPETLRQYLSNFHSSIVGLTGNEQQVKQAADAFRVYFEKAEPENYSGAEEDRAAESEASGNTDYLVNHSANIYLMSPGNDYITHFNYGAEPKEMAGMIRLALDDSSQ